MLNPAEDDLAGGWTPLAANTENTSAAAAIATTCHRYDTTKSASTRTAASPRSSYARLVACIDAASASTGDWEADDATEAAVRDEKSSSESLQEDAEAIVKGQGGRAARGRLGRGRGSFSPPP